VDAVIHCAAYLGDDRHRATCVNVDATVALAHAASRAQVPLLLFLSTQSVGIPSVYGRSKQAAEVLLGTVRGLASVIVRPGLVVGPGAHGVYATMRHLVTALPVLPLPGARTVIQPIHVDDLCRVLLACVEQGPVLDGQMLHLGMPGGLTLANCLRTMAWTRGRGLQIVPMPWWMARLGVRVCRLAHLPVPVTTNNLRGLAHARPMETRADMQRFGLADRTVDHIFAEGPRPSAPETSPRPVRILLLGAGHIGRVQAFTIQQTPGVQLVGVVDPQRTARWLWRHLLRQPAPIYRRLDEAWHATAPQAVVIATPSVTHCGLVGEMLLREISILVEKPLTTTFTQWQSARTCFQQGARPSLLIGYTLRHCSHVVEALQRLRRRDFGSIQGFQAVMHAGAVQAGDRPRWQTRRETAGGGVLINAGIHLLSLIHAAFGTPRQVQGTQHRVYSVAVEDRVEAVLTYPAFQGTLSCDWTMTDQRLQTNRLLINTDQGTLLLTNTQALFCAHTHEVQWQRLARRTPVVPEYLGDGFAAQIAALRDMVRGAPTSEMIPIEDVLGLEALVYRLYATLRTGETDAHADSPGL